MKKILALFGTLLIVGCFTFANAATPDEALAFFNKYINAANTYSDTVVNYYAPDAKIIREGINSAGKHVSVEVGTKQYFNQLRLGQNLAKINKYKNSYVDRKITKEGEDYKITCTRIASTGTDKFPSYFVIGPDAKGDLKIKTEMTTTKQQSILKHGK